MHDNEDPQLWAQATALTSLKFCDCDLHSLSKLQQLPKLKTLTFDR